MTFSGTFLILTLLAIDADVVKLGQGEEQVALVFVRLKNCKQNRFASKNLAKDKANLISAASKDLVNKC